MIIGFAIAEPGPMKTEKRRKKKMADKIGKPWYRDLKKVGPLLAIITTVVTLTIRLWPHPEAGAQILETQATGVLESRSNSFTVVKVFPNGTANKEEMTRAVPVPEPELIANFYPSQGTSSDTGSNQSEDTARMTSTPAFSIEIKSLAENTRVSQYTIVDGISTAPIPESSYAWVVILYQNEVWPQKSRLGLVPAGQEYKWSMPIQIGEALDSGKTFAVLVLLVAAEIDHKFTLYFKQGQETGRWPGFVLKDLLDKGAIMLDDVTVQRR
jgi:hypothetical protein